MRYALASVALIACSSGSGVQPCGLIPEGGCPLGRGGTCADRECDALYDCLEGKWTLAEVCSMASGGGGAGGAGGSMGVGGCNGVIIDRTGEAEGCTPDLLEPDCPADAAESCRPCISGCVDFFLGTRQGWQTVAFCDARGEVVLEL
jgi:hypothetical protein